ISETYPFFVLTDQNNAVIGYAYANRFRERKAYDYIAESSVYLKHTEQRKGGGKMLYEALLNELKSIGIKEVIGVVTLPNKSSEKFHLKTGFVKSGTIKRAGIKFEKWWDIALYQKSL
ncbi:MAG: GNAT family N-acetyltransferase, partial [Bacteroidia bacterium]